MLLASVHRCYYRVNHRWEEGAEEGHLPHLVAPQVQGKLPRSPHKLRRAPTYIIRGGAKIQAPLSSSLSPSNTIFCLMIILSAANASPSSCKANCHKYPRPLPKTLFCKTFSDVPTWAAPGGFCSALLGCLANLLIITFPQLALRAREVTCCHSMQCFGGRHRLFVSNCSHST